MGAALSHAIYGVTRWAGLGQLQKQKATSDKAGSRMDVIAVQAINN